MNLKQGMLLAACLAAGANSARGQGVDVVGHLGTFQFAKLSNRPVSGGAYRDAAPNEAVHNGDGLRTLRRGSALINFNDRSVLRLNELTELIVQDSVSLRRLQLAKGALWIRVTKGSNTAVQTPVATATVRGTEFLMDSFGNLAVREGIVELEAGGFTIDVMPGEIGGVGPDGKPFKKGTTIPTEPHDTDNQGVPPIWWESLQGGQPAPPLPQPPENPGREALGFLMGAVPLLFIPNEGAHHHSHNSVPEPSVVGGLLMGGSWLALRARRKR